MEKNEWTINFELSSIDKREKEQAILLRFSDQHNFYTGRKTYDDVNEWVWGVYVYLYTFNVSFVILDFDQIRRRKITHERKQLFLSNTYICYDQ